jgi:hypothetical protein
MFPSTPDRPTASIPLCLNAARMSVFILPAKNHLCHFKRCIIGYAPAFNYRLFDTEFFREVTQLFAAAVNDADANSYLMKKGQLFRERREVAGILGHFAGQF